MKSIRSFSVTSLVIAVAALLFLPVSGLKAEDKKAAKVVKPYPLDVCLVSDEAFGGDMGEPYVVVEKGQEIKLCCKSCLKDFNKNKKDLMARVEAANRKVKPYPAKTCAVSGHAYGGDMGEPYVFVYKLQEIKLCCKDCLEEFNQDKDGILKKVIAAAEKK
jgi:hypothetical protein